MSALSGLDPWAVLAIGAGAAATLALLVVIVAGYAAPARRTPAHGGPLAVGAGALVGGAFASLARQPGPALLFVIVGFVGSLVADVVGAATGSYGVSNVVWWIADSLIVFYWHRAILLDEAQAAGFDVKSANPAAIFGRSWLVGAIVALSLLLCALPALVVLAGARVTNVAALLAIGGATGIAAVMLIVWNARLVLTFPATAVRQPEPGVLEMHKRGKGLGVTLTAGLASLSILFVLALAALGAAGDWAWRTVAPDEWSASLGESVQEAVRDLSFRPWEFVLFNVPAGIALAVFTVLCVALVSVAYRRWILPEYAAGASAAGALAGLRP